ncbi:hypothetical protein POM88_023588 [Heracleum sosnowskyi]|uniref:Uncharacterized protein n=1 Tax=Heracleum sosnowskyi TaxID=360622 RepID=A0AAD8IIL0_9APIA|nr:hypothetical protein POM88_023588 [Heracleum sosnowskyi]
MWELNMVPHVFGNLKTVKMHLPKRLFKVYSEFGHKIKVHVPKFMDQKTDPQWLAWIIESPYWTSESSESESTTVYAHLLPNESHNFMAIILCFQRTLHLKGCNSSLLASIFTESFFQMYFQFGHLIQMCSTEFPDWISQPTECELTKSSDGYFSTMFLNLPPNVSPNYLGMILCIRSSKRFTSYSVTKGMDGNRFTWSGEFESFGDKSLMVIVPRSTFAVEDGDDKIKLEADGCDIYGIHLLYYSEGYDSSIGNED